MGFEMLRTVKFAIHYIKLEKNHSRCNGRVKEKPHLIDSRAWALKRKFVFDSEFTN